MSYELDYLRFNGILSKLKEKYVIYAPLRIKGAGRFSDTDIIKYGQIEKIEEIIIAEKSHFSPKEIIFPITQTLFHFIDGEYHELRTEEKGIVIFMRPCDINGLGIKDIVFLKNGELKDVYYQRLRNKVKIFMLECTEGFDSCFCVSMGTNKTELYDVAVQISEESVLCEIKNTEFEEIFVQFGEKTDFVPNFIEKNKFAVSLPDIEKINEEFFEHELWSEYSKRCIGCGRCNFVCPTCTCWTMQDIAYGDNKNAGERRRVWAGCHVDGFTDMAGGHGFRKDYGSRMRFKTMHKIYDFKKRNGIHMCTGCGRCDDTCPEYISFASCINKVTKALEEVESNGE